MTKQSLCKTCIMKTRIGDKNICDKILHQRWEDVHLTTEPITSCDWYIEGVVVTDD